MDSDDEKPFPLTTEWFELQRQEAVENARRSKARRERDRAKRAGIASVTVAFDRYGHLYPNEDRQLADQLAHIGLYQ